MKYDRFEDLPVWQLSAELDVKIFNWTSNTWFRGKGDLANQLQRATLSISNNIAEGFERGTTNELLQFLYIARGSAGEVRSMLGVVDRMVDVEVDHTAMEWGAETGEFKLQAEQIAPQIRAWTNSLQNSGIQGQRHLNDDSRRVYEQQKRRQEFQRKLNTANEVAQQKRNAIRETAVMKDEQKAEDEECEN